MYYQRKDCFYFPFLPKSNIKHTKLMKRKTKPTRGQVQVSISMNPELIAKIAAGAAADMRTRSNYICVVMEQFIAQKEKKGTVTG